MQKKLVSYFRSTPILKRFFDDVCRKYRSLGRIGGSVTITTANEPEARSLSGLLGIPVKPGKPVVCSLSLLEKQLVLVTGNPVDLLALISVWTDGDVETNDQRNTRQRREKEEFFAYFLGLCRGNLSRDWLTEVIKNPTVYRREHAIYKDRPRDEAHFIFSSLIDAFNRLPLPELTPLPIFAHSITGNPHSFDDKSVIGQLFRTALSFLLGGRDSEDTSNPEWDAEVMYSYNIAKDDVSITIPMVGLLGFKDQTSAIYMEMAAATMNGYPLTLDEIVRWEKFVPLQGYRVFVVENPSIFSALRDRLRNEKVPVALICSSGQFRLPFWQLMNRIVAGGSEIYYSGDFDPEGIVMAERVKPTSKA